MKIVESLFFLLFSSIHRYGVCFCFHSPFYFGRFWFTPDKNGFENIILHSNDNFQCHHEWTISDEQRWSNPFRSFWVIKIKCWSRIFLKVNMFYKSIVKFSLWITTVCQPKYYFFCVINHGPQIFNWKCETAHTDFRLMFPNRIDQKLIIGRGGCSECGVEYP